MYHRLENVADERRLDQDKFAAFCERNYDRFSICRDGVHGWYVDDLVKAYRESIKQSVVGNS